MNFTLTHKRFSQYGIFGSLVSDDGKSLDLFTLEHAYRTFDGFWLSKIPKGAYICVRGQHQLAHMVKPFTTFEVTGVPGHTDILFHIGNSNADSSGCILLGLMQGDKVICASREAFDKFISIQEGVEEFTLTVENHPV